MNPRIGQAPLQATSAAQRTQEMYRAWQARGGNPTASAQPEAFQAFVADASRAAGISPAEVMRALAPYMRQGTNPLPAAQMQRISDSATAYLQRQASPPAPPPLPPEEKGFFDRLITRVSDAGSALVDGLENALAAPAEMLAEAVQDVPILGPLAGAVAWTQRQGAQFVGGVLRGAGGMVEGVATMIAHPIDTVKGLATMASHIPMFPANPIRLVQAAWDITVEGAPIAETLRNNLDPRITLAEDAAFGRQVVSAFTEPYGQAIAEGRYGEALGRGTFEVLSMVLTGGGTAAARTTAQGVSVASRVARAGDLASDVSRVARAADTASDVGRVARAADNVAGVIDDMADARRATSALPPQLRRMADEARTSLSRALGDEPLTGSRATSRAQSDVLKNFELSGLDEAGQARELSRLQGDAGLLGREVGQELRQIRGRVAGLDDVRGAEEILERLAQDNPAALRELYQKSYEAVGLDFKAAEQFIHDYTHSSNKVNVDTFKDIGAAAKQVLRETPLSEAEVAALSPRAQVLKQMLDTREMRQQFISEVLGVDPPAGYRVFRGSSNPESVQRAARAWLNGEQDIAMTNRGISSTSLDPEVAVDFSRGGPRSVTVDPRITEYQAALARGEDVPMPLRNPPPDTYINYDLDVSNRAVVFDKYTDGGFSVDGTLAQRTQREVLIGGPQDSFLARAERVQINYKGQTYMYEQRQALFDAMLRDGIDLSKAGS